MLRFACLFNALKMQRAGACSDHQNIQTSNYELICFGLREKYPYSIGKNTLANSFWPAQLTDKIGDLTCLGLVDIRKIVGERFSSIEGFPVVFQETDVHNNQRNKI